MVKTSALQILIRVSKLQKRVVPADKVKFAVCQNFRVSDAQLRENVDLNVIKVPYIFHSLHGPTCPPLIEDTAKALNRSSMIVKVYLVG